MPLSDEVKKVMEEIDFVKETCQKLINVLPSFDITDKKVLPYGLKPHTRSVSWIVEQVIVQQTKFRAKELCLDDVKFDMPDTCLHDCEIQKNKKTYFVNVKISNTQQKENKNDIAAVEKLFMAYSANKNYNLIYACFGIIFQGIRIQFDENYLKIFSPQFLPIYVNPRNDKIQAYYQHKPITRTRKEFLNLLVANSKSIVLRKQ